jgi:carboxylesterase type B
MQPLPIDFPLPSGIPSENCLYLNIWTPTLNSSANLPVMFWIHGGSFQIGSGAELFALFLTTNNIYDGTQLALRDVVVITINYRLGIFGFLYGNRTDAPGNAGFWDQAVALNWTKQNIRAFGGNPNDITLFGESAGSISISNHIVSNVTRNLFRKAIMQSGIY